MWLKKQNTIPCNCVKLASADEEQCRYAFVDTLDHQANRILMGALIPTSFEEVKDQPFKDADFELRICSFKERYESWFLCCMSDLEWVLENEPQYVKECERIFGASVVIRAARREFQKQKIEEKPFCPTAGLKRLGLTVPQV